MINVGGYKTQLEYYSTSSYITTVQSTHHWSFVILTWQYFSVAPRKLILHTSGRKFGLLEAELRPSYFLEIMWLVQGIGLINLWGQLSRTLDHPITTLHSYWDQLNRTTHQLIEGAWIQNHTSAGFVFVCSHSIIVISCSSIHGQWLLIQMVSLRPAHGLFQLENYLHNISQQQTQLGTTLINNGTPWILNLPAAFCMM